MIHPHLFLLVTLLLSVASCTALGSPNPTPSPTYVPSPTLNSTPTPTLTLTSIPTLTPDVGHTKVEALLDAPSPRPFDYAIVSPEPPRRVPNAIKSFWVTDHTTGRRRQISARLRVQTEHVAMWVEEGLWHDLRQLQEAAQYFESQIYPATRSTFGSEWIPGIDNDPHIHVLHVTDLGEDILAYTSSADEFPQSVYPTSNQAEMITIHADVDVGSPSYYATLARHFQRLIQWFQDRNEERWLKEGLAELSAQLIEPTSGNLGQAYVAQPDVSLTTWQAEDVGAHREAAYLFVAYFHQRFGDEGIRKLVSQPLNGIAGFDATLTDLGADLVFEDLFVDWLAANYLDAQNTDVQPDYHYIAMDLERPALAANFEKYPVTLESSVQQFGADYILLQSDSDLRVQFTGTTTVTLISPSPHSGRFFWWSHRVDESMTTLARTFDFSVVPPGEPITLSYWTLYDIEQDYDYVTVEASVDGGTQWHVLSTPSGTGDNPYGNNPGWAYTGRSGDPPQWIQEKVDLSPYAGGEVVVRFAYLTDEAVTGEGFLLDDIAIPAIGYIDDVESEATDWESKGFVHSDGETFQRYLALFIGLKGEAPGMARIRRLPVAEDSSAEWILPLGREGWDKVVLSISGLAPFTVHPAAYRLRIEVAE